MLLWPDATLQQAHRQAAEVSAGRTALFPQRRALRQPGRRGGRRQRTSDALPGGFAAPTSGRMTKPTPVPPARRSAAATGIDLPRLSGRRAERFSRAAARCLPRPAARRSSPPAATTGFTPATCGSPRRSAPTATSMSVVGHDANIRLLKGEGHPLLSAGGAPLRGRLDQICEAGAHLHRRRLAGCRPGNPAAQAGHLRRQRGRRQGRQARVLRRSWASNTSCSSARPRPACPGAAAPTCAGFRFLWNRGLRLGRAHHPVSPPRCPGPGGRPPKPATWEVSTTLRLRIGTLNPGKERELSSTRSSTASSEPLRIETIRGPGAGSWEAWNWIKEFLCHWAYRSAGVEVPPGGGLAAPLVVTVKDTDSRLRYADG